MWRVILEVETHTMWLSRARFPLVHSALPLPPLRYTANAVPPPPGANLFAPQGRDDEAKALIKRALATVEKAFGPSHPVAVQLRTILGPGGWGSE